MSEKQQQEIISNHHINRYYELKQSAKSESEKMYYEVQIQKELMHKIFV